MNRPRVVLKSIFGTYLTLAVQMAVTLTTVPLAIKHLGEIEYGRWVGLNSMAGWAALTDLGVSGMLTYHLSKYLEQGNLPQAARMLWHGLVLSAVSALIGASLILLAASVMMTTKPDSFRLAQVPFLSVSCLAAGVCLSQVGNSLTALQQARLLPISNSAVSILASLGSLAVTIPLLPVIGGAALAVGQLVRGLLLVGLLGPWNARFLLAHLPAIGLERCLFAPFFAAGVIGVANRWLQGVLVAFDAFMVAAIQGPGRAANYVNTSRPASMATGLACSLGTALMPLFSRFHATQSAANSLRIYVLALRMNLAVCGALAMAFVVSYSPLISWWIGPEFILPAHLVAVITIAAVAQAWLGFASYVFGGSGHFIVGNRILLLEGVLRGALMMIAVNTAGVFGLAVVAAITQGLAVFLHVGTLARVNNRPLPWRALAALACETTAVSVAIATTAFVCRGSLSLVHSLVIASLAGSCVLLVLALREPELRCFIVDAAGRALRPGPQRS